MGTGQYDYNIYQTLSRIENLLEGFSDYFDSFNSWFQTIAENLLPLACGSLLLISAFTIIKWVVKL